TQKQGRCGLARRLTCREQQRDLELLRRQLVDGGRFAAAECLAAGLNLAVRSVCPWTRVEALKGLHGHAELLPGSYPVSRSAQTLAVGQSRARGLERVGCSGVLTERVFEMRGEFVIVCDHSSAAKRARERPRLRLRPGRRAELSDESSRVFLAPK